MRLRSIASLAVLVLLPGVAAADFFRHVDPLTFSIHVDLLAAYDLEDLRRHLEDARAIFQGSHGPTDVNCCTQIDAIDLEIFGNPGDGLDVIDTEAKWNLVSSMNALVLDITWPSPACGRVRSIGGTGMVVALDCANIGQIIAHERGHNAGLLHREDASCQPVMGPSVAGGCLSSFECLWFLGLGMVDGVCSCLSPLLADGSACTLDGEVGVCRAAGVCIEGEVSLFPYQKISDTQGGFVGGLDDGDHFTRVASLGDLDGDAVGDLAVGAWQDDDGGPDRGAVWILFLNSDGTVKSHQKISDTQGGFTGTLDDGDSFGWTAASLGDLDGDGVGDLVVGAISDDDGGPNRGAVWILFLNRNGTVKSHQKISDTQGGFAGGLDDEDDFARVASLGDLDGDGVGDLAVGAQRDDDGGVDRGAVWILFLNFDGTVKSHQKISDTQGGFTGTLNDGDLFGFSASHLGDFDGDGVTDLAAGAREDDDGGRNRGALWILLLNPNGTVKSHQKISDTQGGFTGTLDDGDWFGYDVAALGDLDGDRVTDLAAGAREDDDGGPNRGALWILLLNPNGTVKSHQKISNTQGGFTGTLDDRDRFGYDVAALGDLNGDGVGDLAVAARNDDDGGVDRGAVWILFMPEPDPTLLFASALGGLIVLRRMRHLPAQ